MKRIYKTLVLALALKAGVAQTSAFWTATTYKGAFDCSAPMWTAGWTEWDPQNASYPAPTQTITGNITSNTTWVTGQTYLLQGQIYVKNNSILTIQPGVVIRGDKSVAGAGLFITQGSKIMAVGTASQPIVFTSDQAAGGRNLGDWGGIILMGNAALNFTTGVNNIEGIAPSTDTQYGGGASPNNNDNSGTLQYVRIEFGGYVYQPNKEINGLTMGAVGKGTTIDHIQVSFANDDGYEWFGGNVNCKYLVSYRNLDDDFDTDNGFSGYVQFGLSVRDPNISDNPSVSTSEGFESDNDASGTTATPLTSAVFSNMTLIGPLRGSTSNTVAAGYRRGARIRRNSNLKIFNSIFMDHLRGVHIDGSLCEANAGSGALKFAHNVVAGNLTGMITEHNSGSSFNTPNWFGAGNPSGANDSLISPTGILVTPYNYTSPDYRPVCSNSLVVGGANFSDPAFVAGGIQGINDIASAIKSVGLYPNPATAQTSLIMNTEVEFDLTVRIFNVTGQVVATPYVNYSISEGESTLAIETTNLTAGVYFMSLETASTKETIKLILNK